MPSTDRAPTPALCTDGATRADPPTGAFRSRVSPRDAVAAITELGLTASAITSRAPTLDDVYLQHTGESLAA